MQKFIIFALVLSSVAFVASAADCDDSCATLCKATSDMKGASDGCNKPGKATCDGVCKAYYDAVTDMKGDKCYDCSLICTGDLATASLALPSKTLFEATKKAAKCATSAATSMFSFAAVFASFCLLVSSMI
eukprot:TRINITY_DN112683_c0_g1_i1.p1 TRINITY_DN112683_c0_g1~~TRINITY_DN112683_c0_g1_i1.p1  ORF type:complete len:131 (-),score=14.96 TRINITY_DN112683_c0_g1_i1:210-602(-)